MVYKVFVRYSRTCPEHYHMCVAYVTWSLPTVCSRSHFFYAGVTVLPIVVDVFFQRDIAIVCWREGGGFSPHKLSGMGSVKERGKGLRRTGVRRAAAAAPGPGRGGRVLANGMSLLSRPETVHSKVVLFH